MAKLIIFDDTVRGVDLPDRAVIVGRSLKVDIPIRDRLLSRKHCTLVPEGRGYRFLDLKSANGSYVNGVRVDKVNLECDDVIEIGSTVLVLLEADTWERGEGLAKLRNPVKAQELIQRIKKRQQNIEGRAIEGRENGRRERVDEKSSDLSGQPQLEVLQQEFLHRPRQDFHDLLLVPELLEGFLIHKVVSLLVRRVPELRECLSDAMERVLTPENFQGGFEHFRSLLRQEVQASLEEAGLATPLHGSAGENPAVDGHDLRWEQGLSEAEPPEPTPRADSQAAGDGASESNRAEATGPCSAAGPPPVVPPAGGQT